MFFSCSKTFVIEDLSSQHIFLRGFGQDEMLDVNVSQEDSDPQFDSN